MKTLFTQELADAICQHLAEGWSLRSICSKPSMPHHSTVLKWARENPEFCNQYARAREDGDDFEFEGLVEISDAEPIRTPGGSIDAGWVAWQRNRIDTRKWALSKKRPKKYGEKVETVLSGEVGIRKIERVITRNPAD